MRDLATFLLVLTSLSLIACTEEAHTAGDEDEIRGWFDEYVATVKAGDIDGYWAFWSEDVVWLPPNQSIMHGREACMEMARSGFEQYMIDQEFTIDEILFADGVAIVRIHLVEKATPRADASPGERDVKGIFILKRKADGSWVSTHCIWNSNTSPSP